MKMKNGNWILVESVLYDTSVQRVFLGDPEKNLDVQPGENKPTASKLYECCAQRYENRIRKTTYEGFDGR